MRDECARLLKSNPRNVTLLSLAGSAAYGLGQYAEAVQFLERALSLRPGSTALKTALERARGRL